MEFSLKYMMVNDFEGRFKMYDGKINSNSETDFSNAVVSFMVDTRSVETGDEMRDKDLKSKTFFNADKFPRAEFTSTSFKPGKVKGTYDVEGDLTIKENTKKVKFTAVGARNPVTNYYSGKTMYAFNISGKINRGDFGVGPYEIMTEGGIVLGEEITLNCNLMLVKTDKLIPLVSKNKIKVDIKTLDSYIGQYQVSANINLTIYREGDHLVAMASGGQSKNDIFPETSTKFFWEFADMKIEFLKNDAGEVDRFVLYKDGMKSVEGKKTSNEVHLANNADLNKENENDLTTAEGLRNQGWEELQNKEYVKANNLFKEAIKKDPEDINAKIGLGHAYLFFGSVPQAVETYREAVGKKNAAGKSGDKILQEDFLYFKSRKYPVAPMDKVFVDLKLQPNSTYENMK
jgi:polyisoprenoid-binding protein YceI